MSARANWKLSTIYVHDCPNSFVVVIIVRYKNPLQAATQIVRHFDIYAMIITIMWLIWHIFFLIEFCCRVDLKEFMKNY